MNQPDQFQSTDEQFLAQWEALDARATSRPKAISDLLWSIVNSAPKNYYAELSVSAANAFSLLIGVGTPQQKALYALMCQTANATTFKVDFSAKHFSTMLGCGLSRVHALKAAILKLGLIAPVNKSYRPGGWSQAFFVNKLHVKMARNCCRRLEDYMSLPLLVHNKYGATYFHNVVANAESGNDVAVDYATSMEDKLIACAYKFGGLTQEDFEQFLPIYATEGSEARKRLLARKLRHGTQRYFHTDEDEDGEVQPECAEG